MANHNELAALHSTDIIENVGVTADRLVASCRPDAGNVGTDMRELLERALIVAAEVQQQLAEQSQRISTLETLSYKDELTGLLNRRGFNQQLRHALAIARRVESTGVLSFIDLDNFKAIRPATKFSATGPTCPTTTCGPPMSPPVSVATSSRSSWSTPPRAAAVCASPRWGPRSTAPW